MVPKCQIFVIDMILLRCLATLFLLEQTAVFLAGVRPCVIPMKEYKWRINVKRVRS